MGKIIETIFIVLGIFLVYFFFSLLFAWPFMLLWNWLMPVIFGLCKITFWQSLGLMILCSFLFKSSNTTTSKK